VAFTVGWPEESSPISVEEADAYFTGRGITAWTGDAVDKETALTRATDYVKAMFAARFDPDLFLDEDDAAIIPSNLKKAVAEYGLVELGTPGGLTPVPVVDASGYSVVKTKRKVGPIESGYVIAGGDSAVQQTRRKFPLPDALIASLLLPSVGLNRVTR
jgi:hypothetical protein